MKYLSPNEEHKKVEKFYEGLVKYATILIVGVILGYAWCWNALN